MALLIIDVAFVRRLNSVAPIVEVLRYEYAPGDKVRGSHAVSYHYAIIMLSLYSC
jgi:hypothetical protein